MDGNSAPLRVHTRWLGCFSEKEVVLGWLVEPLKGLDEGVTLFGKSHSQAWFPPPTLG